MKYSQLVLMAICQGVVNAWDNIGHMTVAAVAKANMKNPTSIQNVENILTYLDVTYNDEATEWTAGDADAEGSSRPPLESNNLVIAAKFPDDSKVYYNVGAFSSWHYINQKYDPEGLDVNDTGCKARADVNAVTQVKQLHKDIMANTKGRQTAHWYAHFSTIFLTHIIGDLHQPFHAVARCMMVDGELDQDRGGNRWIIYKPDGTKTHLHNFWDSAQWLWADVEEANIRAGDSLLEKHAAGLMAKYPLEKLADLGYDTNLTREGDTTQLDASIQIWLEESKKIAIESYEKLPFNTTPTAEYMEEAHSLSEQRVVLGGYRLAAVFDGLFANVDFPPLERAVSRRRPIRGL